MSLSDSQVRALKATDGRQNVACGNSLYLIVEPASKGGGKSFVGRYRFPPGRSGKQKDYRIGPYGKGPGKWSLKEARDEWERVRTLMRETNQDPAHLKKKDQEEKQRRQTAPTLEQASEAYLENWCSANAKGKKEYRNLLWNQMLPEFGHTTPVEDLSWDHVHPDGRSTRDWVTSYLEQVRRKAPTSATRQQMVLKGVFDYAIHKGWVKRDQNPAVGATTPQQAKQHKPKHRPHLRREDFPEFFRVFNANAAGGEVVTRGALLLVLMTGLRVEPITGMEWSEVDEREGVWKVPYTRMKTWTEEDKEHVVHLTDPMWDLLERMGKLSAGGRFVFPGRVLGGEKHINNSVPNNHLIDLGFKGVLQAGGMRPTVRTVGSEVTGTPDLFLGLNGGWKMRDRITGIYQRNAHLPERKKFLIEWSDFLLESGMDITLI